MKEFRELKVYDMPKIECPFIRKEIDGRYLITSEINPGYEWVFTDETVKAIEKLHGTNVSILIIEGAVVEAYNRTERIPFINKGKAFITQGLLNSKERGYIEFLPDGQHFGELVGPKVNGNPYNLKEHLWIPFESYAQKHLMYKSWGKYPKTFDTISAWFEKDLLALFYAINNDGDRKGFVEGIVFTHPNGSLAKIRRDMFPWYKGQGHKE
jgi:hypothetical protein